MALSRCDILGEAGGLSGLEGSLNRLSGGYNLGSCCTVMLCRKSVEKGKTWIMSQKNYDRSIY